MLLKDGHFYTKTGNVKVILRNIGNKEENQDPIGKSTASTEKSIVNIEKSIVNIENITKRYKVCNVVRSIASMTWRIIDIIIIISITLFEFTTPYAITYRMVTSIKSYLSKILGNCNKGFFVSNVRYLKTHKKAHLK